MSQRYPAIEPYGQYHSGVSPEDRLEGQRRRCRGRRMLTVMMETKVMETQAVRTPAPDSCGRGVKSRANRVRGGATTDPEVLPMNRGFPRRGELDTFDLLMSGR
jgi:hypothetical protein